MPAMSPNYEVLVCGECGETIGQIFTDAKILKEILCKSCILKHCKGMKSWLS